MEPLDTDFEYVVREPRRPRSISRDTRINVLLFMPVLGALWLLYLIGAAVFQWPITDVINPVMTLMLLIFVAMVATLFWAFAPNAKK